MTTKLSSRSPLRWRTVDGQRERLCFYCEKWLPWTREHFERQGSGLRSSCYPCRQAEREAYWVRIGRPRRQARGKINPPAPEPPPTPVVIRSTANVAPAIPSLAALLFSVPTAHLTERPAKAPYRKRIRRRA